MKTIFSSRALSVGLALFAMLFGSGNIVYPLMLGRAVGDQAWWGMAGFFIAAVCMPLIGVIAGILFDGNYAAFMARIGAKPGMVVTFLCLALIGPFGVVPRCVTLAYAPVKWYLPTFPLWIFTIGAGAVIFACTLKQSFVVQLLGRLLGPVKFALVGLIIVKGLLKAGAPMALDLTSSQSFMEGIQSGYGTMDLIAAIFFSSLIVAALKQGNPNEDKLSLLKVAVAAGCIGALLLGVVYAGFVLIASRHGAAIFDVPKAELFSALACYILGSEAGLFANITVAITCMTTAIALTTIFAQYLANDLFKGKVTYIQSLVVSLVITIALSNLGFETILILLDQAVNLVYPALIVLAVFNIAYKVRNIQLVKLPFFAAVGATVLMSLCR